MHNKRKAVTKRVGMEKPFREDSAVRDGGTWRAGGRCMAPAGLRGIGQDDAEHGFRAAHRAASAVRLRQVPPVIAAGYAVPDKVCSVRGR